MSGSLDVVRPPHGPPVGLPPERPDGARVRRIAEPRSPRDVSGFLAVADDLKHLAPLSGGAGRSHWKIGFISALAGIPADDAMGAWWQQGHSVGLEYLAGLTRSAPGSSAR